MSHRPVSRSIPATVQRARIALQRLRTAKQLELLAITPSAETLTDSEMTELLSIADRRARAELPNHLTPQEHHDYTNWIKTNAARQWNSRASNGATDPITAVDSKVDRGQRKVRRFHDQLEAARTGGQPLEIFLEAHRNGGYVARTRYGLETSIERPTAEAAIADLCAKLRLDPKCTQVLDT